MYRFRYFLAPGMSARLASKRFGSREQDVEAFNSTKKDKVMDLGRLLIAFAISGMVFIIILIRACYSNVWYDEAYTYLYYVLPIVEGPSLETVIGFWENSLANNHWLNTLLIAFFTKLSGIYYEEIILRFPAVLFSMAYLTALGFLFVKKKISIFLYMLLACNYYLVDFMRQARGYGMAAVLVLFGMVSVEKWREAEYRKHGWMIVSLLLFLLSAYANTTALIPLLSYGAVMLLRLLQKREFVPFVKRSWLFVLVYTFFFLMILKYHFMVSNVDAGKPLYRSDDTSLFFIMQSYVSMLVPDEYVDFLTVLLLIVSAASLVAVVVATRRFACDHGIAFLIYLACLVSMNLVFRRGGFQGRTLLPGYPLVVAGAYEVIGTGISAMLKKFNQKRIFLARQAAGLVLSLFLAVFFVNDVHLLSNGYWKIVEYENPENVDRENKNKDPSETFYQKKKEWNIQQLAPLK